VALKSAVELSPHRLEIDKKLLQGDSPRTISNWLANLPEEEGGPEKISHSAINNYRKKHLNIQEDATIKYNEKKSQELKAKAIDETVSDLEYCDDIIRLAQRVDLKVDPEKRISELDIKRLGLQAIKMKQEIFKAGTEEDREFTIKIIGVDGDGDENHNLEAEPETGK